MVISNAEAAVALNDIQQADRRTRVSGAYGAASPHFILWGLIWIAGYSGSGLLPTERWGLVWLPLILVGIVSAIVIGQRARSGAVPGDGPRMAVRPWQSLTIALALAAFMGAAYTVFQPVGTDAYLVFPALLAGLLYVTLGALALPRYVWIGVGIFAATMVGYLFFRPHLAFWIAAAGGGGLVLGGIWLRRV